MTELWVFALSPPVPGEHALTQELVCLERVSHFSPLEADALEGITQQS